MILSPASGRALVTGASTGIGAVYADRLARRGHALLLVARDRQRLDALAARLASETGVDVETLPADLTQADQLARVEARLRDDAGIDVLVNNAGVGIDGPLIGADPNRLDAMIALNVGAVTRLAVAAATAFAARRRGLIINIASVLALAPERFNGSYSGTKAYVLNLSQGLHAELQPLGVRVHAVLPGATRTELWERAGIAIDSLPDAMLMGVDEMVDAALAGLDQGELVTIPSLPRLSDWDAFNVARQSLGPHLSLKHAAPRYTTDKPA
jgi:uncharacterized protein